jgi:hypothetical protein
MNLKAKREYKKRDHAKNEFQVGKHNIGWLDSDFTKYFGESKFGKQSIPTFQTLPRQMDDSEIESELKPGLCELGDILAFLKNPPEKSKDGYANLFYTSSCVVRVRWHVDDRRWCVSTWRRDGSGWSAGRRVFSPATDSETLGKQTLRPSDTLSLESRVKSLESQVEKLTNWANKLVPPEL